MAEVENNDWAIRVDNISKTFKLPHERSNSIKSAAINVFSRKRGYEIQQALKGINFEIKKGEFFGIVGRNGSGKSTLLKIMAGIYNPSEGEVKVNGSLVPFIELGVGFNPELTGRENVYLNGALLGISRKQMKKLYDKIVKFAELERFMDQRLKNYSSGMQVRLAFSIAIQAPGDILLLDEVLAVGDSAFQRKCLEVFREYKKQPDKTVILVTHGMGTVQEFCDRALMLEDSKVVAVGDPMKISAQYELANSAVSKDGEQKLRPKNPDVKIKAVTIHSDKAGKQADFKLNEDILVDVDVEVRMQKPFQISVAFYNTDGEYVSGITSKRDIDNLSLAKGKHTLRCRVAAGQFSVGAYRPRVSLATDEEDPDLIDVASSDYGVPVADVVIAERSEFVKGQFYMSAEWQLNDKKNV